MKSELKQLFEMSDLGQMTKILGVKVFRDRTRGILEISQEGYIEGMLQKYNMSNCHPVSTPLPKNVRLERAPSGDTSGIPYANAIGGLMYAALGSRPDIAYAVQYLSTFTHAHSDNHWSAVKRVFRYLQGTKKLGVRFVRGEGELELTVYADADFANAGDAKSVSGYACMLGGGVVSWSSKKQSTVALSTTEAEYIALTHASKQLIWIRRLLNDIGIKTTNASQLHTDNLSAMFLAHDNGYHGRTKHIKIAYHFIREVLATKQAALTYVPSKDNSADILTKALDPVQHGRLTKKIGVSEGSR